MKIVCSGCKIDLGEKEPKEDSRESHTICPKCGPLLYGPEMWARAMSRGGITEEREDGMGRENRQDEEVNRVGLSLKPNG